MNIKSKLITIFPLAFLFISCDPAQDLDFINKSNSAVKIKLNLTEIKDSDLEEIATGDSIILNLKPKDTANINFGIGNWADSEINKITNCLKSIEIETSDIKTIYKSKTSIRDILTNNRKGFWVKSRIIIEIE